MKRRTFLSGAVALCLGAALVHTPTSGWAWASGDDADAAPTQCKLVVVIVIDQLRADYLTRFGDLFGSGGFKLLTHGGAWFVNCHYEYGVTKTGPGHASIATGCNPSVHGIVGNDWHERVGGELVAVNCVRDPAVRLVGAGDNPAAVGASAGRLLADTLAEKLKAASPASRVLSCSLKDSAAALLAGPAADGVYWWDRPTGLMVTSTGCQRALPQWAEDFNGQRLGERYADQLWTKLAPESEYLRRCRKDAVEYEQGQGTMNAFPHRIGGPGFKVPSSRFSWALWSSPLGNDLVLDFARRGIEGMKLGQRAETDLLLISLSSNDIVGHEYGPYSHEVMDITLRTDRQLADFFDYLDEKIGLQNCIIALTSDHGACMVPEYAREKTKIGGRTTARVLAGKIDRMLAAEFGKSSGSGSYVADVNMPWVYFHHAALRRNQITNDMLRAAMEKWSRTEPSISTVFLASDIQRRNFVARSDRAHAANPVDKEPRASAHANPTSAISFSHLRSLVKACYHPARSGDAYLHLAENWYASGKAAGHGSAHPYDTHVPLLLLGPNIKPGKYQSRCAPTDLAPTLAKLLNIPAPSKSTGRSLREALK